MIYTLRHDSLFLDELYIYGSQRIGLSKENRFLARKPLTPTPFAFNPNIKDPLTGSQPVQPQPLTLYTKRYELTDWLGNVRVVITNKKIPLQSAPLRYRPDVVSVTDYYAFGSEVRERTYEKLSYEYGFNGQIEDNEITGNNGSHLAFEYRIYDSRLGKFLSVDPLLTSYPWNSTYAFAENRVIDGVDLEGMEYISINNANIDLIEPDGRGYTVSINGSTYCASGIVSYNNEQYLNLGQHVSVDGEQISSFFVTKDQLQSIFPNANTASINSLYTTLNNSMMNYSINNHISLAHFLSQAGHETGGFAQGLGIEENLNYSVSGLVGTFGRYFYTGEKVNGKYNADLYGRKQGQIADQEGIANIVYANRMGNGSIESGDGYNYRGRGIFQLTGRDNYTAFNTFLNEKGVDLVSNPSLLSSSNDYAIKSALWFYKVNVINRININKATVKTVSAYVNNGGNENKTINGLSDRENYYKRAIDKLR